MWLVHAGNRVDEPDRPVPRFPASNVAFVETRLRRFLSELRPDGVVSAAAAGADLLLLDVALELGVPIEVVLPLPVEEFRRRSVDDQAGLGSDWGMRFERVRAHADCLHVVDLSGRDDWYLAGNDVILDHAVAAAGDAGLLGLAIRPPDDDQGSVTDDFVRKARNRRLSVIDIDPASRTGNAPSW